MTEIGKLVLARGIWNMKSPNLIVNIANILYQKNQLGLGLRPLGGESAVSHSSALWSKWLQCPLDL